VIGRARVGLYAGYYVIKRAFDAKKITWGWQTHAWSGGHWDPARSPGGDREGSLMCG
jgi:hypothetical protein